LLNFTRNRKSMHIYIINGPNLNLLGTREPHIYGNQDFDSFLKALRSAWPGLELSYFQSNDEGALVTKIQEAGFATDGILLNAAAYTHTSIAIADAIAAIPAPVIEVHLSNPHSREDFRRTSYLSPYCKGVISGFGLNSYRLALEGLIKLIINDGQQ
jgi:3-dehydroquinate dehydratase II